MLTERIETIVKSVSTRVTKLIPSERFYIALYDSSNDELSFPWVATNKPNEKLDWGPRLVAERTLPDLIIMQKESILIEKDVVAWLEREKVQYWPDKNIPKSWIGVPMILGEHFIGILVVENFQAIDYFNENDLHLLNTVARQAALAIDNARLYSQLEIKVENLRILNRVGQQLTKGLLNQQENDILELIYESATKLEIDTRNMYIAFYDTRPNFPDTPEEIHGSLRFPLAFDEGKRIKFSDRPARNGLTEYVIRTKESFNPPNVEKAYQDLAQDQIGKIPRSWLGVPMLSEGQVFGVIALRNNDLEGVYTQEDQEVLETLAGQVAIAIQNKRLYDERINLEKMSIMSLMAAEFAHKMNNLAGTIPVRVEMAKQELSPTDPKYAKVTKQLNKIEIEAKNLLEAAKSIRESIQAGEVGVAEEVKINELLKTAIARAKNAQVNEQSSVETVLDLGIEIPSLYVDRNALLDTLTSIIKNSYEAIDSVGKVIIQSRLGSFEEKPSIEIEVKDTGKGIPPSRLSKIFDLFYTTKGEQGLGFGLWRDKVFIKNLGGDIDVHSEENKGSTFIIKIPISANIDRR